MIFFIRCSALLFIVSIVAACSADRSKSPVYVTQADTIGWPSSFHLGRVASLREIDSLDIDVRPDGKGLPEGVGTVSLGRSIYALKCARCHGATGVEGPYNKLVTYPSKESDKKKGDREEKTIGSYWPYASTIYDYLQRTMPYDQPGSLTPEEIYSLTAWLLHANSIIDSTLVLDSKSLPKVVMPAQKFFVPDDREETSEVR